MSASNDTADSSVLPIQGASHPQLLVSVRNPQEFLLARDAGVDIIDFKEPDRGALAPTEAGIWRRVDQDATRDDSTFRLSAALGEEPEAIRVASSLPGCFHFAKAGPSRCGTPRSLKQLWHAVGQQLAQPTELVAVAYADNCAAQCLPVDEILIEARKFGLRRLLVDTFMKQGQSSIDVLGLDRLRRIAALARKHQMWWALAGSIRSDNIHTLRDTEIVPNCLGVRGDVCEQGRRGMISVDRVRAWRVAMAQFTV